MERQALLTKVFRFEAAHTLPGHRGKCARLHGHSYVLEVTLRGPIKQVAGASDDGMVMDFDDLSRLVRQAVLERLDHQYLNDVVDIRTTAENLAHWIWNALLAEGLAESLLHRICLWETAQNRVEITAAERG
ncbi:MAG TPA: 6-carboxytetrahydropterin synthase QueD [Ktedonobacteraceae bacterium]|nr:6-carboxytetrahydropterin synthase QueD [Ktedonobacteraceae bacterium]